jgi:hypothetical protein
MNFVPEEVVYLDGISYQNLIGKELAEPSLFF